MKKIIITIIMFLLLGYIGANATSYTWNGATRTAWNTTTNWTPNGTPGSGDFVTITSSGTNRPLLPANITLNGISITGGTFNLNGDTLLLNSGTSNFSGGTISNGLLQLRGTDMTFSGTTFSVKIDAIVNRMNFNGGTFNNFCHFESVNSVPGTGTGGCVFNDSVLFYHNYTGGGIWTLNTTTGNRFNGKVTISNKSTSQISTAGSGVNVFNGNLVIENTGTGGIYLGDDTLKNGYTISIGPNGYSAGEFRAPDFYQEGSTAQSLAFTGTALPTLDNASFNGNFTITSGVFLFKNCMFYGTSAFTMTGTGSSNWSGNNRFYGDVTVTNNATGGSLKLEVDTANTYYGNATFNGSRDLRVCSGTEVSSFYGNITAASNTSFTSGTGTVRFSGSSNQTINITNSLLKVTLNKTAGYVSLGSAHTITGLLTFIKGNLITTGTNLLTITNAGSVSGASDSSFIDGPVKKIGNSAFVFPVGKGATHRAIQISAPSNATDAFTGEYFNTGQSLGSSIDTSLEYINDCNYWSLNRNTGSSSVYVSLNWDSSTCELFNRINEIAVSYWNGTKWIDKGQGLISGDYSSGSVKSLATLSSFGNFTWGFHGPIIPGCSAAAPVSCQQELVCNGGFEQGCAANAILNSISLVNCGIYSSKVTGWSSGCPNSYLNTTDLFIRNNNSFSNNYNIPYNYLSNFYSGLDTWSGAVAGNNRYLGALNASREGAITDLTYKVVPGFTYYLSFYATTLRLDQFATTPVLSAPFNTYLQQDGLNGSPTYSINQFSITNNGWNLYGPYSFTMPPGTSSMGNLILRALQNPLGYQFYVYFDDVSIIGPEVTFTVATTNTDCSTPNHATAVVSIVTGHSPYTYAWSGSASTSNTATGLVAGTHTVTVTDAFSCSSSLSFTVSAPAGISTVSISKTNVTCKGGNNGTATATPTGGVSPYSYQWSSGGALTSQTNTALAAGTYTVTVTDAIGCTKTASVTINYINNLPPKPKISGTVASCLAANEYYVTNLVGGSTYTWSTTNTTTTYNNVSGNNTTAITSHIDWMGAGTITFTVNNGTCTNSQAYNIYDCCEAISGDDYLQDISVSEMISNYISNPSTYNNFTYSAGIAEINTGGTFGSTTVVINGTLTVDHDLIINNANITMGPDAEIVVVSGFVLEDVADDPVYYHGCDEYMWKSITIQPGGTFRSIRDYFEDAQIAVHSLADNTLGTHGIYSLTHATFNKNITGIKVEPFNGTHAGRLVNSHFKCTTTLGGTTQGTITMPPAAGKTSTAGVDIDNVTGSIIVGYYGASLPPPSSLTYNEFNGLEYGVKANNSNLTLVDNYFLNIKNYNGTTNSGVGSAIYLNGQNASTPPVATIGGWLMGVVNFNAVEESDYGVYALGNYSVEASMNFFSSTTSTGTGIRYATAKNATFDIVDAFGNIGWANVFNGLEKGIEVISCVNSTINILGNEFYNTLGDNVNYTGITLRNVPSQFQNMPNTTTIDNNIMEFSHGTGINLLKYNNAQIGGSLGYNMIGITTNANENNSYAIRIQQGSNNTIKSNTLYTHISPDQPDDNSLFGIQIQTPPGSPSVTTSNVISSNTITAFGTGIRFLNVASPQGVECNLIDGNWSGVRLNSSSIGDQRADALHTDQNNIWIWTPCPGPANCDRNIVSNPIVLPSPVWYYKNATHLSSTDMVPNSCMDFQLTSEDNNDCMPQLRHSNQIVLLDIAKQVGYYDSLTSASKYWADRQLYQILAADDSIMLQGTAADTILRNWMDSVATENIGLLEQISDSLEINPSYSTTQNSAIVPNNHAEENEVSVNAIYLTTRLNDSLEYSTIDHEALFSIAKENAITGGSGTYMARAMLGINADDDDGLDYFRLAGSSELRSIEGLLYPNPAGNEVHYSQTLNSDQSGKLELFDILGHSLYNCNLFSGNNLVTIKTSGYAKGVYLVKASVKNFPDKIIKLVIK